MRKHTKAFTTKQTFGQMVIHQSKEWPADLWKGPSVVDPSLYDDNDIGPSNSSTGDRDAPVFLSPQDGDYWVFDRSGDNRYHGLHSTGMITWVDKGRIGNDPEENGFRWVTTAEYHDGKIFIYTDRPNDDGSILSPWPISKPRTWRAMVNRPMNQRELNAIRRCVKKGCPYGSDRFVTQASSRLQLKHTLRERGRPKKVEAKQ